MPVTSLWKTRFTAAVLCALVATSLAGLVLTGCDKGKTVATVNGQGITETEFNGKFKQFFQMNTGLESPDALNNDAAKPLLMTIKKETLDFLIQDRLVKAEVAKRQLAVSDKELETRYQSIVKDVGVPEADFLTKLAKHGMTKDTFRQTLKDQLVTEALVVSLDKTVNEIPEADIQRFFASHHQQYDVPPMREARHILIQADMNDAKAKASAQKAAEEVLAKVKADPKQFEALAKSRSADKASADNGGGLGFFSADMMVPTFSKAVFSSPLNSLVPRVVESPYGFHVIQVLGAKPGKAATLTEKRNEIRTKLREQRLSAVLNSWLSAQKETLKITYAEGYDFEAELKKQSEALTKQAQSGPSSTTYKPTKIKTH